MSHYIQCFIAKKSTFEKLKKTYPCQELVDLDYGLALLPLTEEFYDAIPPAKEVVINKSIRYLSQKVVDFLIAHSSDDKIGYFETDYFGGPGEQGAVLAESGRITFGPVVAAKGPINELLKRLGVICLPGKDEFDTVGLVRFRRFKE